MMADCDDVEIEDLCNPDSPTCAIEEQGPYLIQHERNIEEDKTLGSDPFSATIYLKTFGCAHNISDGEYMKGLLSKAGYRTTEKPDDANVWILNSCTVKDPSEMAFVNLVKEGKQKNKKVIISGCVPQADRSIDVLKNLSTIGTHQIERVVEVVEETLKGNTIQIYETKNNPSLILPKVRKNEKVEILIISSGCLGKCTFCKTRFARGTLKSYPPEMILNRVKEIVKEGIVSEIWISSEDTGAYGQDIGTNLPALLKEIIKLLPENMMLRVGMTNPPYIAKYKKEIAEILNNPRVFSFLHIPVQSGSDHVLELMNRQYKIELFRDLVDYMISQVRGVTIATDIICGFSGETEEDHKESVNLLKEYEFPIVNISQYYPRKGTPGALMKRVDRKIVKERSREISALFNKYEPYKGLLHKYINVFISNEIDGKHNVCHTKSYIKVLVDMNEENKVGSWIKVYVTETSRFHVVGKKVDKADTKYVIHHLMVLIALSLLVLSLVVLRKFVREL